MMFDIVNLDLSDLIIFYVPILDPARSLYLV